MNNFPCICGHRYDDHERFSWNGACWVGITDEYCPCKEYKLDNLKYLESKYNEKENKIR